MIEESKIKSNRLQASGFRLQASGFRLQATGSRLQAPGFRLQALKLTGFSLLLAACCLQLAGCGYTTRSMILDKNKTIYVTPFINKVDIANERYTANKYRIYRPTLETDITKAVINKFLFDGSLKPAKEEVADLILKGELIEYRKDPVRYDDNDNVAEYRINIIVNIILWDRLNDKMVWQENGFTGDTTYFTTGSNAKSEDAAINDALLDLSRRIVRRIVEQW